jgi:hypothetical protein
MAPSTRGRNTMEKKGADVFVNALADIRTVPSILAAFVNNRMTTEELTIRLYEFVVTIIDLWAEIPPKSEKTSHVHYWAVKVKERVGVEQYPN